MKASIIVALDSNLNFTDNFLYFLSQYKNIEQYELIFTSDGNNDVNYKKVFVAFSIIINTSNIKLKWDMEL